jgi:beta-glucosidase
MLNNAHIIRRLTEDQKIRLLTDIHTAEDPALAEVGLPRMRWRAAHTGRGIYPSPQALARSWDGALAEEVAAALCRERLSEGAELILTPAAKPRLLPRGQGLSEDPLLSGELAAAWVKGITRMGMPCAPEGFGLTETERSALRCTVTPAFTRTFLKQPYARLKGCAGIVTEGDSHAPTDMGTVLCRRAEGVGTVTALTAGQIMLDGSEETLRRALHTYRRIRADIPRGKATTADLEAAVARGEAMSEEALDGAVDRLLDFALRCEAASSEAGALGMGGLADGGALSRRAALASIVLLENRGEGKDTPPLLPLRTPARIALIGQIALEDGFAQGELTGLLTAAGHTVVGSAFGYHPAEERNDELTREALALAALADTVLLFVGFPNGLSADARPAVLPPAQRALCDRVSRMGKRVAVILSATDGVDMTFVTRAETPFGAVLLADVTCRDGLWALGKVLTGGYNPDGRLPMTLCAHDDPSDVCHTRRPVGPFVGYRYYDTVGCGYLYPFGHGLSYTKFRYEGLKQDGFGNVTFTLRNVGAVAGVETVQIYRGMADSAVLRPRKELVGFTRVALNPGESTTVTLPVGEWFAEDEPVILEKGRYTLYVGASVADIRLTLTREGGGEVLPSDGEDPADYLPTVSNIQTQRYKMEAEYTPMKPSLRNLIFGIASLCLAVSVKIYDILTASGSVFLNIVAALLAVGGAVFFGLELTERRKQVAALAAKHAAEDATLFADAASIPVPSAAALFEEELYIPAEESDAEEPVLEVYDSFADVDKTLTFTDAAAELALLARESGLTVSEETAREVLAAMASSRLILTRSMDGESFAALVTLLGEYFSSPATPDRVTEEIRSESALLFDEDGEGNLIPTHDTCGRYVSGDLLLAEPAIDPAVAAESGWKLPEAVTEADGHKLLPLIKYYKTPDAVAVALRQKVVF